MSQVDTTKPVAPIASLLEPTDVVLREKNPWALWWWFGWTPFEKCPGSTMWRTARGMSTLALYVVVAMTGYDVVTQDFLFGNPVLDLAVIVTYLLFSIMILHFIEQPFRNGFLIVDPHIHHIVFLFFLLDIVLGICLAVVTTQSQAIALAPLAVNPFSGTAVHEAIYIVMLVLFFLIAVHGFIFLFSMMSYWGLQVNGERTYAFKQYWAYYHKHQHFPDSQILVPQGSVVVNSGGAVFNPMYTTNTKSQSHPLLGPNTVVNLGELQKLQQLQSLTQQNSVMSAVARGVPQNQQVVYNAHSS